MGGLALYNQVKEKWPQVKIIFVTGHPMGGESKSLLEEKQITWLHKPFSVPEFFATVEDLLASG
jgi:DNA-binding NtrC family response regulator